MGTLILQLRRKEAGVGGIGEDHVGGGGFLGADPHLAAQRIVTICIQQHITELILNEKLRLGPGEIELEEGELDNIRAKLEEILPEGIIMK